MEPAAQAWDMVTAISKNPCLRCGLQFRFNKMMRWLITMFVFSGLVTRPIECKAVAKENLDESRVPPYTLPDPLVATDGSRITSTDDWIKKRRPEILRQFETEVYGRAPKQNPDLRFHVENVDRSALGGKAIRKQVTIQVTTPRGQLPLHLLLYLPKSERPVPVFLGLNFHGNQAVHADPGITLARCWVLSRPEVKGIVNNRATEASRGCEATRWPVEKMIERGYGFATMCCGDIDPDFDDGFQNGVHPLFYRAGQTSPAADEWGSIAAWAWGLSRALDYLQIDSAADAKRVAVCGHSRLGKTALWAGATDERFALVISNDSGCGGAALSKRVFGETVGLINKNFPHWFCRNFRKYSDHEDLLPVDQHELIALIAPRPVYVASASLDVHADPRGEFLSAKNAEHVYRLFGKAGLDADDMPLVDRPIGDVIHYHLRTGKHDMTAYDWNQYLDFADSYLRAKTH
jgi:hypothetical protein